MIKNIIWDIDGTLFDTYPAITKAFQAALADLGKSDELGRIENLAKISLGFCTSALAAENQLSEDKLDRAFGERCGRIAFEDQPPFPGVHALCDYIRSVGGKNVIVTHRGRRGTDGLLAAHGLTRHFSGSITREDGYPRKPDPAAFEAALQSFGLQREETLVIGEREIDVLAGKAAGMIACLFGGEGNETSADLTIRNFSQLHDWIVSNNG